MEANGKICPTIDEFVGVLKNTSLPTVVCEGEGDEILLRKLEREQGFSTLPVGGKNNVLSIFQRKSEFLDKEVVYLVDKDNWALFGVPDEYNCDSLVLTDGYSIENDVFRDLDMINLLTDLERNVFNIEIEAFAKWYSVQINRSELGHSECNIRTHPERLFNSTNFVQVPFNLEPDEQFPHQLHTVVSNDYFRLIRGKSLFGIIYRQICKPNRNPRHNNTTNSYIENASIRPGENIRKLYDKIVSLLS